MTDEILESLNDIEKDKGVKILYACESGSRAWGFSSTDSDFDVRFIYMHEPDYYLSVFDDRRDVIELPINDLLDVSGWDLKKSFSLLYKNNLALFEWINSPIVYLDRDIQITLQKLVDQHFKEDRAHYHYLSMASGFYKNYLLNTATPNMKKLFYCLRTTLACLWVKKYRSMPPVLFTDMLNTDLLSEEIIAEISLLIEEKSFKGEGDSTNSCDLSLTFIKGTLSELEAFKPDSRQLSRTHIDLAFRDILKTF